MRLILFGAPGSGKGTQVGVLSEYFKVPRISLGDMFRNEVSKNSDLGNELKSYMEKGLLVPDEVVTKVIAKRLDEVDGFVLEGYPRTLNQANTLEELLQQKEKSVDAFVDLAVDEQIIVDRLSKRRICPQCKAVYHLENVPPKVEGICDHCQTALVQRDDDKPEVIKKRWEVFMQESKQILDFYRQKNKLIVVNGAKDKKVVLKEIIEKLQCQQN